MHLYSTPTHLLVDAALNIVILTPIIAIAI